MRFFSLILLVTLTACQATPDHLEPEDDLTDDAFALVDQNADAFAIPADLRGKPSIVTAVYTHCPDVCLMTMANMTRIHTLLGADTSRVQFATLTFDPERDTPQTLSAYAESWKLEPDWKLLTGAPDEVARLMDRLRIRTQKETPDTLADGTPHYLVSHSDKAFLLDAQGRIVESYGGSSMIPEMVADDARALLD